MCKVRGRFRFDPCSPRYQAFISRQPFMPAVLLSRLNGFNSTGTRQLFSIKRQRSDKQSDTRSLLAFQLLTGLDP